MSKRLVAVTKWFAVGLGVKRWLLILAVGVFLITLGLSYIMVELRLLANVSYTEIGEAALLEIAVGLGLIALALVKLSRNILAPYRKFHQGDVIDVVYAHRKRGKGIKVVVIGGGTGLPSVLRGLKQHTSNITAVVTVADDGGSSGRLRREFGVLPPGDLRNNIAALADDENLMAQLFQYRFDNGDLGGHAFGNLFITALAGITGSLESALVETERVLNIQGRVLPATLEDVNLVGSVRLPTAPLAVRIEGESQISEAGGWIEKIELYPKDVQAYPGSVQAILDADLVIIGPGSLYTSILPNLLVKGIANTVRAARAYKIYICNVATQPGETEGYTVADHVIALENHIGRGVFQVVLANDAYPTLNAGVTHYVPPAPNHHEIFQRYDVRYVDLTDSERPWRHDSQKLVNAILNLVEREHIGNP